MKLGSVLAAILLGAATVCGAPLQVAVSIPPQAFVVEGVGCDRVAVTVLVGAGNSPHDFEPRPRQLVAIARSRIYFTVGLPFEERLKEKLAATNEALRLVDMSAGVPRRRMACAACDHGHGHDHEGGALDPHVWLSPRNMARMATAVRDTLREVDPDGADEYLRNCSQLLEGLLALDAELTSSLAPLRGRSLYVFHPAFGYFADHYGLVQVPIEIEGKEPSARQLARLIRRARKDGVRVIFVQRQFARRAADKLAEAIGGVVVGLDPLSPDYVANLRTMARDVKAALARGQKP